jgi:gamma-glutamyltranspeptidase/glutathione hydrolase/leukotriene-C4 hydrolase
MQSSYYFSGVMSESTGIIFNNEMNDFSTPNKTNLYGIAPSEVNFIRPQKRPTSSMSPTIMLDKNNNVKLVIGASGGPRIISAIAFVGFKIFTKYKYFSKLFQKKNLICF